MTSRETSNVNFFPLPRRPAPPPRAERPAAPRRTPPEATRTHPRMEGDHMPSTE
jgi:hypothetical protein